MEDVEAMTRRGMCFTECRMCVAVVESVTEGLVERVWREVKVAGKITKPASNIHYGISTSWSSQLFRFSF